MRRVTWSGITTKNGKDLRHDFNLRYNDSGTKIVCGDYTTFVDQVEIDSSRVSGFTYVSLSLLNDIYEKDSVPTWADIVALARNENYRERDGAVIFYCNGDSDATIIEGAREVSMRVFGSDNELKVSDSSR